MMKKSHAIALSILGVFVLYALFMFGKEMYVQATQLPIVEDQMGILLGTPNVDGREVIQFTRVEEYGSAYRNGVRIGDVLKGTSLGGFARSYINADKTFTLTILRDGEEKTITLVKEGSFLAYEAERDACIAGKQEEDWDNYDRQKAEYVCSTVDLGKKYYAEDPTGIVNLCVYTSLIGNYTKGKGLAGALSESDLAELHTEGTFLDVTMDDQGVITVGEDTLENWRGICQSAIENVVK